MKRRKKFTKTMTKFEIQRRHYKKIKYARLIQPQFRVIESACESLDPSSTFQSSFELSALHEIEAPPPLATADALESDPSNMITESDSSDLSTKSDSSDLSTKSDSSSFRQNIFEPENCNYKKPIYKFATTSLKDFLVSLNILKSKHNMSDLVLKDILELFAHILPKPNNIPKNNNFVEKNLFNPCEG